MDMETGKKEILTERVIDTIKERRQNIINGNINCIPSPFVRFRSSYPGIEMGRYTIVSAATKVGKTQLTSFILYNALDFAYNNPDKLHLKVFYFPLEEAEQEIVLRYMSYLLYDITDGSVRISPTDLMSTDSSKVLPQKVLEIMENEEYKKRLKFFEDHVEFSEERNCTGIYHVLYNYAKAHGESVYNTLDYGKEDGTKYKRFSHYIPNDPLEYVLPIVDHVSLLSPERGFDLRQSINKMSEYFVILRNRYKQSPLIVQQQSTKYKLVLNSVNLGKSL